MTFSSANSSMFYVLLVYETATRLSPCYILALFNLLSIKKDTIIQLALFYRQRAHAFLPLELAIYL